MRRLARREIFWLGLTFGVLLSAPGMVMAEAGGSVQFCWAMGHFDGTVYMAEAENREDRRQHFADLLTISGIEYGVVHCISEAIEADDPVRRRLLKAWRSAELEVVDTTFLSDMDY